MNCGGRFQTGRALTLCCADLKRRFARGDVPKETKVSSEIYYFSGTGNSLQIARLLGNRLPECKIIPIVGLLGQESVKSSSAIVGIVFPVHALSVPLAVVRFIRKIDLSSAKYLFAVATRLGIIFDGFTKIDRLLQRQGKRLQAQFTLNMPSNDSKDEKFRELTRISHTYN